MKRSTVNAACREALDVFRRAGWFLPPQPRWDVSDCGSGDFTRCGLVLVNLADEPEYSEKIIYMRVGQKIPLHAHRRKKEDIICRRGELEVEPWAGLPETTGLGAPFKAKVSGETRTLASGQVLRLAAGERITIEPGIYHRFWPIAPDTLIGEVATANDDAHDNFFVDASVTRFPVIEEDEPRIVRLVSDR